MLRADGCIEDLGTAGTLIGGLEAVTLTDQSTTLRAGDSIVMFSDGLSESRVGDGSYLERAGIRRLLQTAAGLPATEVLARLDPLNHGAQQRDDLAILVARVRELEASHGPLRTAGYGLPEPYSPRTINTLAWARL